MSEPPRTFDGLAVDLGSIWRLSTAESRSISAENPTGAPGAGGVARDGVGALAAAAIGPGWKSAPAIVVPAGGRVEIASIDGPGAIQQLWFTVTGTPNLMQLEICWDAAAEPAVHTPLGAFFCCGWDEFWPVASLPICLNPRFGLASYWPMPFAEHARITISNCGSKDEALFYQINYALGALPDDTARFHAQYRHRQLEPGQRYVILDDVAGPGHYVGTALAWAATSRGWWGEGEVRFAVDGDGTPARPGATIVGTGLEDYVGGAWGFAVDETYRGFSTPHTGFWPHDAPTSDPANALGRASSPQRFDLYRWHIADPVRYRHSLTVSVDALGWNEDWTYRLRDDEVRSVAMWYQQGAH